MINTLLRNPPLILTKHNIDKANLANLVSKAIQLVDNIVLVNPYYPNFDPSLIKVIWFQTFSYYLDSQGASI